MCVIPRQMTTFKGAAKAIKLFAKHIKVMAMVEYNEHLNCAQWHVFSAVCLLSVQIEEQVKLLQKGVTHIGVGTPARINALIEKGRCGEYVTVKLQSLWCLWKNFICFVFSFSRGFELAGAEIPGLGLELEGPEAPKDGGHSWGEPLLPPAGLKREWACFDSSHCIGDFIRCLDFLRSFKALSPLNCLIVIVTLLDLLCQSWYA